MIPRLLLAVGGGAVLIAAALVFTADSWVRPLVVASLNHSSGREIRIDELHIHFARNLAPTLLLRGVKVQNTAWAADARPMATAREVTFVFDSLPTLLHDQTLVSLVVMQDADIDLERQADGLRNWRLRKPDYRGPGKYLIQRVEAHNSRLRVVHRGINLDVTMASSPAAGDLPNRIRFSGDYAGRRFDGDLLTSAVFSLQATGEFFPLRGQASSAGTRLQLDGRMADFLKLGGIDAQMNISGPTLSQLHPFLRGRPPASRPYEAQGHLSFTGDSYSFDHFTGKLGATELAGFIRMSRYGRRVWHAGLTSAHAQLTDLTSLSFAVDPANPNGPMLPAAAVSPAAAAGRIFPASHLAAERLQYSDAHVRLDFEKLESPQWPVLQSLHAAIDLENGVLRFSNLDLGIAGGHATGDAALDGRQHPPVASVALDFRGLRPDLLMTRLRATGGASAPLSARVRLRGQGETVAAMLASADGKMSFSMAPGRISNLLDAMLGLNAGKLVWLKLTGDHDIALNCAALNLDFKNGIGRSSELLLDTAQTHAGGSATINLRDEHFDLLLTPQSKQGRLFALGSAIHASGSFRRAQYAITQDQPRAAPGAACPAPPGPAFG
ncbi:MAG TPA: AsmA family protein [Burkholderiales bacterium]